MMTAIALTVTCPRCQALPGAMCTYALPEDIRLRRAALHWLSSTTQERAARVGQVMKRCHNERYALAWQREQAERRRQWRRQLGSWLAAYGDIFKE